MNPKSRHWWDEEWYREESQRAATNPTLHATRQMEAAADFVYELVRRLSICEAKLPTPHTKESISSLPICCELDPSLRGVMRSSLWRSWGVRPVAYRVPGLLTPFEFENYNGPKNYEQPPFAFDLTATFDAIQHALRVWYVAERKKRSLEAKPRKEVVPFRVTWDRVGLLESPYGNEKNRKRERAIDLAKRNLSVVMKTWGFWQERQRSRLPEIKEVEHVLPETRQAATEWPVVIFKPINLSSKSRPASDTAKG